MLALVATLALSAAPSLAFGEFTGPKAKSISDRLQTDVCESLVCTVPGDERAAATISGAVTKKHSHWSLRLTLTGRDGSIVSERTFALGKHPTLSEDNRTIASQTLLDAFETARVLAAPKVAEAEISHGAELHDTAPEPTAPEPERQIGAISAVAQYSTRHFGFQRDAHDNAFALPAISVELTPTDALMLQLELSTSIGATVLASQMGGAAAYTLYSNGRLSFAPRVGVRRSVYADRRGSPTTDFVSAGAGAEATLRFTDSVKGTVAADYLVVLSRGTVLPGDDGRATSSGALISGAIAIAVHGPVEALISARYECYSVDFGPADSATEESLSFGAGIRAAF